MVTPRPFSSCQIVTKEKPRTGRGGGVDDMRRCCVCHRLTDVSIHIRPGGADDMLCLVSGAHEDAGRDQGDDAEQLPQHHRPPLMPG